MRDIIIVGAGPVGLWLAAELQLRGIATLVLEQAPERDPRSRAVGMQPRILDTFALRGIVDRFLPLGVKVPTNHFGGSVSRLDFAVIDSRTPHSLAMPQALTEQLLATYARELGVDIRTGHRLVSVDAGEEHVTVGVEGPDGPCLLDARWLVGCDGANSSVRQLCGIDFPGTPNEMTGWLADVLMTDPPTGIRSRSDETGTVMTMTIGGDVWRVAGTTVADLRRSKDDPLTLEDVRRTMHDAFGTDFGVHSPLWLSRYGNATRQAADYRQGRVLLAGDAAHMFFPAGGQGVNVGIQDANNLGWKLAAVIKGWAPAWLLDSYDRERRPAAQAVMENTRAQLALFAPESPEQVALRNMVSEALSVPDLNRMWALRVGGYDLVCEAEAEGPEEGHPLLGMLTPDIDFAEGPAASLYPLLHDGRFVLLDLGGSTGLAQLAAGASDRVRHAAVRAGTDRPDWQGLTAALIRPDGHLLWATRAADPLPRARSILARWVTLDN